MEKQAPGTTDEAAEEAVLAGHDEQAVGLAARSGAAADGTARWLKGFGFRSGSHNKMRRDPKYCLSAYSHAGS
ncbi:hypothetical protein [Undibacterium sp.]|uniref:hypothetical protein n=1 Tax=Undibacterium sp. TaxID=1914977 RepID=UPI002D19F04B|nr:hypothetical protein [Undibacterium sp.]HTD05590.1 hypothetical protein [Undibacterium sp.]